MSAQAVLDAKADPTMCFTDPGRVMTIEGSIASVLMWDGRSDVSLRLIEAEGRPVSVGDWVLVSLGLVVDIVDEAAGQALLNEMAALRAGPEP